jgi:hypothetical protein
MGVSEFQNSTVAELSLNIIRVENNSFSTQLASIVRLSGAPSTLEFTSAAAIALYGPLPRRPRSSRSPNFAFTRGRARSRLPPTSCRRSRARQSVESSSARSGSTDERSTLRSPSDPPQCQALAPARRLRVRALVRACKRLKSRQEAVVSSAAIAIVQAAFW